MIAPAVWCLLLVLMLLAGAVMLLMVWRANPPTMQCACLGGSWATRAAPTPAPIFVPPWAPDGVKPPLVGASPLGGTALAEAHAAHLAAQV